jgi:hypothetical protein
VSLRVSTQPGPVRATRQANAVAANVDGGANRRMLAESRDGWRRSQGRTVGQRPFRAGVVLNVLSNLC